MPWAKGSARPWVVWAPVSEDAAKAGNKPVWDVVETWLQAQGGRVKPRQPNSPKLVGMAGNPGLAETN